MLSPRILYAAALATGVAFAAAAAEQDSNPAWVKDSQGCRIANPSPKPKETVTWSGRCVDGTAQGQGVLQFYLDGKPSARYEGELNKGVIEGRGELRSPDGAIYDGDWVAGKPEGYGKYTAPDGSTFVGGWTAGKQHGSGTLRSKDGKVLTGTWKDGQYVGAQ